MPNNNICIDIETLDNTATSTIISIAAVAFDKEITDEFYVTLDIEEQLKLNRTISLSTVQWWFSKTDLLVETLKNRIPNKKGATEFVLFCRRHINNDTTIWVKGVGFDLPILDGWLQDFGYKVPWKYYQALDIRTLQKISSWSIDTSKYKDKFGTDLHNALTDAKVQAYSVIELLGK
jgi:hypothetical protein